MNLLITQSGGSGCHRRGGHTKEDCLILMTNTNVMPAQMAVVCTLTAFFPPHWWTSKSLVPQPTEKAMQRASPEDKSAHPEIGAWTPGGLLLRCWPSDQKKCVCSPLGNTDDDSSHKLCDHQVEEMKEEIETVAAPNFRMTLSHQWVLESSKYYPRVHRVRYFQ